MANGIKRELIQCRKRIMDEVREDQRGRQGQDKKFASGLAFEGYAGGYLQALDDVLLLLNGVGPNSRYWPTGRNDDRKRAD